ncbi:iron-containing alcohol dehydrogenase [Anaerotruncus rubiinfantis]|uniref:iron-containing alcohol dehydrogenase n=1 Tax=Anaerotruncus rubiinfantis TaxID=1720200 RepID=UPI00082D2E15|nr:iron-containing alcohol dehydrogenase [Anaerotruncus rubiinfantis]
MLNFEFYSPTKIYFGKELEEKIGPVIQDYGYGNVLIVYGGGSIKRNGLLGKVEDSLKKSGLSYTELGGVEPNPKIDKVYEGMEIVREKKIDFLLAVGGGSVIDTCKSISIGIANNIDPWVMIEKNIMPEKAMPVGTVLTIAAAGSETSNSHVISNPAVNSKRGFNHDLLRPLVSFLNPENTYSVDRYQTACGIVDIMMHTFERYFTPEKNCEPTDRIAEAVLIAVKEVAHDALEQPDNYEARATLMWSGSLSHNALTGLGRAGGWAPHKLSLDIGGAFDHVAHGAALSVIFPSYCRYVMQYDIQRFARIATRLWGIETDFEHPEKTAKLGIDACEAFFHSLGMPTRLSELRIGAENIEMLASMTTRDDTITLSSYIPLHKKELMEILELAK